MGPKKTEPVSMPMGKMENNVPDSMASKLNFCCRLIAIEPNVIKLIPNINIPRQADIKTRFFLYIQILLPDVV